MKVIRSRRLSSESKTKAKKRKFSCPDLADLGRYEVGVLDTTCVGPAIPSNSKTMKNSLVRRRRSLPNLERLPTAATEPDTRPRAVSFSPEILLHSALIDNNAEELVKLLKSIPLDINKPSSCGSLPIHIAAAEGHVECARVLIENGALLTVESPDGLSPLEAAVYGGNFECAELLITSGAPVDKIKDGFLKPGIEKPADLCEVLKKLL